MCMKRLPIRILGLTIALVGMPLTITRSTAESELPIGIVVSDACARGTCCWSPGSICTAEGGFWEHRYSGTGCDLF